MTVSPGWHPSAWSIGIEPNVAQTVGPGEDFRQVVVEYAAEAARCGAVYIEGSFSPAEPARRGARWEDIFSGYCDGAQEARERFGVEIRLTPEIVSGFSAEEAALTVRHAIAYRERGIVGVGLVPHKGEYSFEPYADVFSQARDGGLGSAPHAGEVGAAASVRSALDALGADRIRHGIRAVDDAALVRELADRGTVLDVCLVSNLCHGGRPLARSTSPLGPDSGGRSVVTEVSLECASADRRQPLLWPQEAPLGERPLSREARRPHVWTGLEEARKLAAAA